MKNIPRAITCNGAENPELSQQSALQWAERKREENGGEILIYAPYKNSIDSNTVLDETIRRYKLPVATWKSWGRNDWEGGPIVALAPDTEHLHIIDDAYRSTGLCVIPWLEGGTLAWELLHNPERLEEAKEAPSPIVLNPVTQKAMEFLTGRVNISNELTGPYDHDDAANVLTILHKHAYPIPPMDLYVWSMAHGWGERGARRLKEMAEKLTSGHRLQIKYPKRYRPDVIKMWEQDNE